MVCPKCGFAQDPPEDSCLRCGVVFSKLASARPERPAQPPRRGGRTPAPPSSRGDSGRSFSLFNVLVLSIALSGSGVLVWQWHQERQERSDGATTTESDAPRAQPGNTREIVVEVPPPPEPETLFIPGLAPPQPPPVVEPQIVRTAPRLPELSESSVSLALVAHAEAVAREFPEDERVREYVASAYLLLAGKEIVSRRMNDALRMVGRAEQWSAPPGHVAAFRAVIYGELESWDAAEKWAIAALAHGGGDNAAEMHHLIGKAYYYREELPKAIAEFRKALAIEDDPAIRASLQQAEREARASAGFDRRRLSHFIVTYEGQTMESTGRMVLDAMERSYSSLVLQFGFEPTEPVVVILYSGRSYREMGGPHWSAGLFDGKIRVPVRGLEHLDQHLQSTLHHELAHAFIHSRGGAKVPRWLHEGIAEYVEGERSSDHGKFLADILNRGVSLEACVSSAQCDVQVFYPAALSLVDYVMQNRGIGGVRDILAALGEGSDIDDALGRVVGRDEIDLIREWQHFVKRRFS